MLRIVYLSHFYPPIHNSGIEQVTHGLAKSFQTAGHDVHVLCAGNWAEGEKYFQGYTEDVWEDIKVRRLHLNWSKAPQPTRYLYNNPLAAEQVREFLLEFQPDVVHVTSMYTLSASIIQVIKDLGLPIVFTLSDFWSICSRHTLMRYDGSICDGQVSVENCQNCLLSESKLYRMAQAVTPQTVLDQFAKAIIHQPDMAKHIPGMRGWGQNVEERRQILNCALQQIDRFISPSAYVRDTILQATGLPLNIQVSHHGNQLDWLSRYTPRTLDNEIHIGYIGQIIHMKGIHLLVEAFQMGRFPPHVHLYIYGKLEAEPDYVTELYALAAENPNIHFMGGFARTELPNVLNHLDVTVVPSIWPEVAGLVVQEAFAAKIPVLASKMGGLPEFVGNHHGGLLFDINGPQSLSDVLKRIVDGGHAFIQQLRATIPAVRTTQDEFDFMERLYTELKTDVTEQAG